MTHYEWTQVQAVQVSPRITRKAIHSASMTGVLARMEELEIIQRQRVASDQRRVVVRLSPKGDQLAHEIAPLVDLQYQQIEQTLGAQVLDDLFNALEAFLQVQNQPIPPVALPPAAP